MTVWFTIGGWMDLRDLFRRLGRNRDNRLDDDGAIRFVANDRHDQVKSLARTDGLLSWSGLAAIEPASMREEAFRA